MRRGTTILLVTAIVIALAFPVVSGAYIDKNTQYRKVWDTTATIDPLYDDPPAGDASGSGDGSVITTYDPNAPEIKYCWILPDEDDQKECVQIHITPSGIRNDIYAWVVVRDPEGRDDIFQVFAQVFYPRDVPPWCGSEKYKEFSLYPVTNTDDIYDALDAALYSGHLCKDQYDDIVHEVFEKPEAYVYRVQLPMEYCEPCGVYKVRVWATDSDCASSMYCTATFEWKCTVVLEYDFTSLNFGKIEAGVEKVIIGDESLSTPNYPTVKNEGNTKVHIQVRSEEMTHTQMDQYKITEFDVYWMGNHFVYNSDGQSGVWTAWQDLHPELCLCQTKQIDFSIHPKENLPPGTYTGHLEMHISKGDWGSISGTNCYEDPWSNEGKVE